jgi:hypothetical protein
MALAIVAGFSARAEAALAVRITQGATTLTFPDVGTLGVEGVLGLPVNGWTVIFAGTGYPITTADLSDPAMDLLSFQSNSTAGGSITLEVSQTDWTGGPEPVFNFNIGGTSIVSGSYNYELLWDPNNALFGGAVFANGAGALGPTWGATFSGGPAGDSQYSLTQRVTITHNTAGFSSFDADLTVPEPASLALFGLGMLGAGIASRRRRTA